MSLDQIAVNGGSKVRNTSFPQRGLLGNEEKQAVIAMFDEAITFWSSFWL